VIDKSLGNHKEKCDRNTKGTNSTNMSSEGAAGSFIERLSKFSSGKWGRHRLKLVAGATFVALIGTLVNALITVLQSESLADAINSLFVTLVSCGLLFGAGLIALTQMASKTNDRAYQDLRRCKKRYVSLKQNMVAIRANVQDLSRQLERLNESSNTAATSFRTLSGHIRRFEWHVADVYDATDAINSSTSSRPTLADLVKKKEELNNAHDEVIDTICQTAVDVLKARKSSDDISANLTLLSSVNDSAEVGYTDVHRCGKPSEIQTREDQRLKGVLVKEHYLYSKVQKYLCKKDLISDCHYLVRDIDRERDKMSREIRRSIERNERPPHHYVEPRMNANEFYRSCLLVPITSLDDEHNLIGILCVESPQKACFDRDYDLELMKQLANYAASVIAAWTSAGERLDKLIEKETCEYSGKYPVPKTGTEAG
jgi:hypothetical protein